MNKLINYGARGGVYICVLRRRGVRMSPQLPWALWWGVSSQGTFKSALQVSTVVVVSSSKAVVKNSTVVVKQHRGSARRCRMKREWAEGVFAGRGVRLRHRVRGGRCSICFA
jgi:hypothetical protein